ncbi:MAG: DUF2306 domain-containing protein [Bacteroidota bacterium]
MKRKIIYILIAVFAIIIGLYPSIYFIIDRQFGLLSTKPILLLSNLTWNIAFYMHIILGGLALLIGWTQFNTNWRLKYIKLHRKVGSIYIIAVILSAVAGFYIAFFATGGMISVLGFMCLAIIWLMSTMLAFVYIKNKEIEKHKRMMIFSYAACFAAVTLRLWLPILRFMCNDFKTAYRIVSWLCWVPNIMVAIIITNFNKQLIESK